MSTINKKLLGFLFNGSALALASAAFKGNLNSITGFNAAGTGFISYRPTSTFNSLTQLVQDGVYIVDAKTPGFDIPGATLTAGISAGPGPMSLTDFRITDGGSGQLYPEFIVDTTDTSCTYFMSRITNASGFVPGTEDSSGFGDWDGNGTVLNSGSYIITFRDVLGNVLTHAFDIP